MDHSKFFSIKNNMISLLSIFSMFLNFKNRCSIQDARAKQSGRRTNQSAPGIPSTGCELAGALASFLL